jgi:hypothetical protein
LTAVVENVLGPFAGLERMIAALDAERCQRLERVSPSLFDLGLLFHMLAPEFFEFPFPLFDFARRRLEDVPALATLSRSRTACREALGTDADGRRLFFLLASFPGALERPLPVFGGPSVALDVAGVIENDGLTFSCSHP